jgi:hypothetical protein
MKKYIVPATATLLLLIGYLCLEKHESHSVETTEFTIEKPYLGVVKELATKNSLERMVQDSNGTITEKNWENFEVEVPKRPLRLKEYKLEGTLRFTVEKKDSDLGELRLPFVQEMHLDKQVLSLKTRLSSPQEKIPEYDKTVEISPLAEEGSPMPKTHVAIRSELKVKKTVPFFFKKFMDEKVAETNKKDTEQLKSNIMAISGHKTSISFRRQ